jgi:hypothetical protein
MSGKGRRAENGEPVHVAGMKNNLLGKHPEWFARTGIVTAAAVATGYWVLQILAAFFVSGAELRLESWNAAALCLGGFVILFVVHLLRPWSKTAAIFGLCSLALLLGLLLYDTKVGLIPYYPSANWVILISTIFGVGGMALDANRCRHLFQRHSDFDI